MLRSKYPGAAIKLLNKEEALAPGLRIRIYSKEVPNFLGEAVQMTLIEF
jgi:hypothetical protein